MIDISRLPRFEYCIDLGIHIVSNYTLSKNLAPRPQLLDIDIRSKYIRSETDINIPEHIHDVQRLQARQPVHLPDLELAGFLIPHLT